MNMSSYLTDEHLFILRNSVAPCVSLGRRDEDADLIFDNSIRNLSDV